MEHRIKNIWNDEIHPDDWYHIQQCELCRKEYHLAKIIEKAIAELPVIDEKPDLENILLMISLPPFLRIWHIIVSLIFVSFIFVFLQYDFLKFFSLQFLIFQTLIAVSIYMGLVFVLGYYLFLKYQNRFVKISEQLDIFFQKYLMKKI